MTKTLHIEGMTCQHCASRVEAALTAIPGVRVKMDLDKGRANLTLLAQPTDADLTKAVEDAGYKVTKIT